MADLLRSISLVALVAVSGPAWSQEGAGNTGGEAAEDQEESGTAPSASDQSGSDGETSPDTGDGSADQPDVVAPTNTENLSMGEPSDDAEGPGTSYVAETYGDWEQRCVRAEEGSDPCQLYQLLRDESDNAVAEMSVFPLPSGQEAAAGSTIITPLETLLTRNIRLSVDDGEARRYPFEFCTRQGCIARIGLTDAEVNQFKRGAAGRLLIVPAAAPDQEIELTISLSGFTAGYEAVAEANAGATEEAPE